MVTRQTRMVAGYLLSPEERIVELIDMAGGVKHASKIADVSRSTIDNWKNGRGSPPLSKILALAEEAGVSLDWVATGYSVRPDMKSEVSTSSDCHFSLIPRYDAVLSAGDGAFNERAQMLDEIPFTKEFLKKRMGRSSTKGLVMLNISGDSMDPTITDGDLVMVDRKNKKIADGIFAFVDDGDARVKRFRRTIGGGFDVISDNKDTYPPEHLSQDDMDHIDIIGRVCWIGRSY